MGWRLFFGWFLLWYLWRKRSFDLAWLYVCVRILRTFKSFWGKCINWDSSEYEKTALSCEHCAMVRKQWVRDTVWEFILATDEKAILWLYSIVWISDSKASKGGRSGEVLLAVIAILWWKFWKQQCGECRRYPLLGCLAWKRILYCISFTSLPLPFGVWFPVIPGTSNGKTLYSRGWSKHFLACHGNASEKYGGKWKNFELYFTDVFVSKEFWWAFVCFTASSGGCNSIWCGTFSPFSWNLYGCSCVAVKRYLASCIMGKCRLLWKLEGTSVCREENVCTGAVILRGARRDWSEAICQYAAASNWCECRFACRKWDGWDGAGHGKMVTSPPRLVCRKSGQLWGDGTAIWWYVAAASWL